MPETYASGGIKKERFGQRFAKEVGMGDPAEENDPPPESLWFSQIRPLSSMKKM